jgi:CRP/FNR family transcriptional regulator, cyclic AMP receptor protein
MTGPRLFGLARVGGPSAPKVSEASDHLERSKRQPSMTLVATKKNREGDPNTFLATIGDGRRMVAVPKKQTIFAQGDDADAVFYVQRGKVRLTVISKSGKEATTGIVSERNFFGEGALAGQVRRVGSAAAMTDCDLLRIDKKAMMSALHREHAFSDLFVAYLLARNIRYEEDLVEQLFNSSEKRLARVLLLLARFGKEGAPEGRGPENQPGDAGRDGRYYSFASQLFHEPVQEVGLHSLQRRATSP